MLKTTFSECDDASYRRVFKALLPFEKEEQKRVCTSFALVLFHLHECMTIYNLLFLSQPKLSGHKLFVFNLLPPSAGYRSY